MKNKYFKSVIALLSVALVPVSAQTSNKAFLGESSNYQEFVSSMKSDMDVEYCQTSYLYPDAGSEPITYVAFNTILNTTSNEWEALLPHYEDYTAIGTDLYRGQTYELKLKGNTVGNNTNYFSVFIDWNQDGQFDASPNGGELYTDIPTIANSTGIDNVESVSQITVPHTALLGNTRMRIIKNYTEASVLPCGVVGDYGQVEDYTLTILEGQTPTCNAVVEFVADFEDITTTDFFGAMCWNANYTSFPTVSITNAVGSNGSIPLDDNVLQIYKGSGISDDIIIVSPELTTTAGTHGLYFDIEIALAGSPASITGTETIEVGTLSDNNDFSTFVSTGDSFEANQTGTFSTNAITFPQGHKYVAIKFNFGTQPHKAIVLDNLKWDEVTLHTSSFEQTSIQVYPNPATAVLNVVSEVAVDKVALYDVLGKQVLSDKHTNINIAHLPKGIYVLQVQTTDGQKSAYKIVKQ
ncbi:MAG: GEVED domain-containing protein [Bacteroidota bacterium]|nr:GEVED domain-containing protein [Bacteroidota bacterium]